MSTRQFVLHTYLGSALATATPSVTLRSHQPSHHIRTNVPYCYLAGAGRTACGEDGRFGNRSDDCPQWSWRRSRSRRSRESWSRSRRACRRRCRCRCWTRAGNRRWRWRWFRRWSWRNCNVTAEDSRGWCWSRRLVGRCRVRGATEHSVADIDRDAEEYHQSRDTKNWKNQRPRMLGGTKGDGRRRRRKRDHMLCSDGAR